MPWKSTRKILMLTMAAAWIGPTAATAQTTPLPSPAPEVIPLEPIDSGAAGIGSPQMTAPPGLPVLDRRPAAIRPSAQRLDYRSLGGHAALRQLRNPFEAGCGPERRGLFGRARRPPAAVASPGLPMTPQPAPAGPPTPSPPPDTPEAPPLAPTEAPADTLPPPATASPVTQRPGSAPVKPAPL